jgi:glycosyltransferase involved in cell wall biosynthesis
LQGEDLFLDELYEPYHSQAVALIREHIPHVDGFMAVSDFYAEHMAGYLDIPRDKIHTVPLGINLEGYPAREAAPERPFTLGYFARVAPEKGLHVLCEAYRVLRLEKGLPPSRLEVAGYLSPAHEPYLRGLQEKLDASGLGGEMAYRGVPDRDGKVRFLQGLDVLSVPSPYLEPKGMYVLESLAAGVPVVQPRHGAFPEILEKTGGGVLFEADDVNALAEAILPLCEDRARTAQLGREGAEGVRRHYGVTRMAERALEVCRGLIEAAPATTGRP